MEHFLKECRIPLQICDTIRLKGITKQAFVQIIHSKDGNSQQLRADLAKNTGLSQPQINAICDRISMDMKLSQQISSSISMKPFMAQSSSSTLMKIGTNGGGTQSKRISALLKQPANKHAQSSNPFNMLQNSSFVVKKQINPQTKHIDTTSEEIGKKVQEESIVQTKIEPMKSPTEMRTIVIDTTVADSGDSANPPSEGEVSSAPAQFVTTAPVQEQASPISCLQKTIVEQSVDQIFDERSASSDTGSELIPRNNQHFEAENILQHQPTFEETKGLHLEDDLISLSSSEDETLLKYQGQQTYLSELPLTHQEQDKGYSSSSSGTLSPLHSTTAIFNNAQHDADQTSYEMKASDEAMVEASLVQEDGPLVSRSPNHDCIDLPFRVEEEPAGFVIQGLEKGDASQEEYYQMKDEDQVMQDEEPVEKVKHEQDLEVLRQMGQLERNQDKDAQEKTEDKELLNTQVEQIVNDSTETKLLVLSKPITVDMGMQCDPWEPQVIVNEPEKKVMKNKKLQVTQERIEKSVRSPSKQQEEQKASPTQQNGIREQQSSSGSKSYETPAKMLVSGRTQVIPIVKQFSQSTIRESSIQTEEKQSQSSELTLSQLIEDTRISSRQLQHFSFSQKPPQVKSILKRFNHQREDNLFTQPDSQRVKWDPNVVEKLQEPGEESYMKRALAEKKKQARLAQQQKQHQQNEQAAQNSSSDEEQNMFIDSEEEGEEEQEEVDIEIQRPQPKRRIILVASRDDTDIKQEESSSDEEELGQDEQSSRGGSCHKIRNSWASGIKTWLNDMSNNGKRASSSQQ